MKITKVKISIFFTAFLIGISVIYLIPKKEPKKQEVITEEPVQVELVAPEVETKVQPKTFDVKDFWNDEEKFNRNFLETGEVSNVDDIKAKSGEIWFGLFNENGKNVLRPTRLKVKVYKSEGLDWKKVSVKDKNNPLFLLKNKKNLKIGEVNTLFRGRTWQEARKDDAEMTTMKEGFNEKFNLSNTEYTLRVEKGVDNEQNQILVLLLETSTTSQIVYYIDYAGEGDYVGDLFWVGDIDHDGKLDLYMDFWNYEKGYYSSGLFLSSEAEKGNLVKKSEYFMLGGC